MYATVTTYREFLEYISSGAPFSTRTTTLTGYEFSKSINNITTATSGFIAHDPYVVGWNQKDLSVFPTEYVTSLAARFNTMWSSDIGGTPTPGSRALAPTDSMPPETEPASLKKSDQQARSGMSASTRTGMIVGALLGVILLIGVGMLLFISRRRRQRARKESGSNEDRDILHSRKGLNEMSTDYQKLEMDSSTVHEVAAPIAELETAPVELETIERPREVDAGGDDGGNRTVRGMRQQ